MDRQMDSGKKNLNNFSIFTMVLFLVLLFVDFPILLVIFITNGYLFNISRFKAAALKLERLKQNKPELVDFVNNAAEGTIPQSVLFDYHLLFDDYRTQKAVVAIGYEMLLALVIKVLYGAFLRTLIDTVAGATVSADQHVIIWWGLIAGLMIIKSTRIVLHEIDRDYRTGVTTMDTIEQISKIK